ncbi:RnfABCDGE type electron transport complex subunit D [Amphibacillus xylanus]|uniref:Ion-translocating oxidoreductase complex subunit D n=1 Tax=Amphibacillus xylanus (strain ATCC 51415 / DSM 6626 / JCM 7361 / LMG 17667 / NBRC 15112 / Ep01) TaxID=698758 RepID=K0J0Y1_AMPXN|nr:RnfABCDGE type electron transport complex subunit D [Amphibacillus xylanus]BAM48525.1 electron transport complex RnfD family protein [Amphibacillus xylanus NBRC 15112]
MVEKYEFDTNGLVMSPSPHLFSKRTSAWIMQQVIIALIFPAIAGTYFFGLKVLIMLFVGIFSSVLFEYLYQKISRKKVTISDYSAVVTGMLIALSLPVTAPLWSIILGSGFAILIVKQIPGGIGRNVFNPAVAARVMLKLFFSPWITNWVTPEPDVVATATPLESIGYFSKTVPEEIPDLWDLFLGIGLGGNIGETSKLAILIGLAYLVIRGIINLKIPVLYVLTVAIIMSIYGDFSFTYMMSHVLSGTLLFGATYMATDYSSGPLTPDGKTVFAIGCGMLTAVIRIVFNFPGGVGFAILIMNALAPTIDKYLAPRIYGHKKRILRNSLN